MRTADTALTLTEATTMATVQLGHIWEDAEPRLAAPNPPMPTDTIGGHLLRAAVRLRDSHPVRPYVTVTATLRVSGDSNLEDCRPVYAARADGGAFLPWTGTGGTLDEAVAECLAEMAADPDAGLRAECDRRGYELVKRDDKLTALKAIAARFPTLPGHADVPRRNCVLISETEVTS